MQSTSIHNFLDKRHSITFTLGWSTFIVCLSALQFGYHLAELNAPADVLSCNFKKPGPLPSYNDTLWSKLHFNQCINMSQDGVALITGMFTAGGLFASLVLGTTSIANTYGRKQICTVAAVFYFIGSFTMSFSNTNLQLNLGRFLCGIGAGSSLIISPILINELAPHNHRGLLGSLMQLAVSIGIFFAQVVSYFYSNDQQWRVIFIVAGVVGLIQFGGLFSVPESPKWIVTNKGDSTEATHILESLRTDHSTVNYEIEHWQQLSRNTTVPTETSSLLSLESAASFEASSISTKDFMFDGKYRNQLIAVSLLMVGQQLAGVNAITYYGVNMLNDLFEYKHPGGAGNLVLALSCLFSSVNVLSSMVVAPLIDRVGRRPLILTSTVSCAVFTAILAIGIKHKFDITVVTACLGFIFSWGIGLGPIPFLMISEFTPHDVVATAQSIGTVMNWTSNMLLAMFFPMLNGILGSGYIFWLFTVTCALFSIGFYYNLPETKGFKHSNDVWENFK